MIEIAGVYRHFGFDLGSRELPDFLPAMVEFLAISLEHRERDTIGLRRRFRETYVRPALAPMREALDGYSSPYRLLIDALISTLDIDATLGAADPLWVPPVRKGAPRIPPITTAAGRPLAVAGSQTP
jgi:nitrate reductase delta subunit